MDRAQSRNASFQRIRKTVSRPRACPERVEALAPTYGANLEGGRPSGRTGRAFAFALRRHQLGQGMPPFFAKQRAGIGMTREKAFRSFPSTQFSISEPAPSNSVHIR